MPMETTPTLMIKLSLISLTVLLTLVDLSADSTLIQTTFLMARATWTTTLFTSSMATPALTKMEWRRLPGTIQKSLNSSNLQTEYLKLEKLLWTNEKDAPSVVHTLTTATPPGDHKLRMIGLPITVLLHLHESKQILRFFLKSTLGNDNPILPNEQNFYLNYFFPYPLSAYRLKRFQSRKNSKKKMIE